MPAPKRAKWKFLNEMDKRRYGHVRKMKKLPNFELRAIDDTMALKMHELTGQAVFDSSEESDKNDEEPQLQSWLADKPENQQSIL